MYNKLELQGKRFGKLTVIKEIGRDKGQGVLWLCNCDCGNERIASSGSLRVGYVKSCGCLKKGGIKKHGMKRTGTYRAWEHMKQRCNNPKDKGYKNYGGRGIAVCERWLKFENFFEDMGIRPEGLTLERKNNELGYYKENCCWDTQRAQLRNQRTKITNRTGIRGVHFNKQCKKYCVQIRVNYKVYHIGLFKEIEQAKEARRHAEKKYWL